MYFFRGLMFLVCLYSCNRAKFHQEYTFIPYVYPYFDTMSYKHLNTLSFFSFGQQKFPKLVFYIDGDCSACFAKIIEWQKFVVMHSGLMEKRNIQTAIVLNTEQLDMLEYNLESIESILPIYIDTAQYFSTYNGIPYLRPSVALLDSNNRLVYSTLFSKKQDKYKELLRIINKM